MKSTSMFRLNSGGDSNETETKRPMERDHTWYCRTSGLCRGCSPSYKSCPCRRYSSYYCACRIYPDNDPFIYSQHHLSFCRFYGKSQPETAKNRSHDDLYHDRRKLYSSMPHRPSQQSRLYSLRTCMDDRHSRNPAERFLDQLPKMAFLGTVYWNGMALCTCLCPHLPFSSQSQLNPALGIIYTIGGIIYGLKLPIFNSKHKSFGSHEIFHVFIMLGSACHFIVMYFFISTMPL